MSGEKTSIAQSILTMCTNPILKATGTLRISDVEDLAKRSVFTINIGPKIEERITLITNQTLEQLTATGLVEKKDDNNYKLNLSELFAALSGRGSAPDR